jgi:hypothetical protein
VPLSALALLGLLALTAPAEGDLVVVETGLTLDATSTVDSSRSDLALLLTLRGGWLRDLGGGLVAGADARVLLEALPRNGGTTDVGSLSWSALIEPRALVGWRLAGPPLSLTPYLWAGLPLGVRLSQLRGGPDVSGRSRLLYGARAGLGATLRLAGLGLSWELGAGARERGLNVVGTLSGGWAF